MAAFIAPVISGLAGLFGGGQQQKTKTSGTINNSQTGTFNQQGQSNNITQNTHNLTPMQQALAQQFTSGAQRLAGSAADMRGYTAGGLQDINRGNDVLKQSLGNTLASKGLSFSPAAANAETSNEINRVSQGNQFLQQVPLLQRQLQDQANQGLERAFSALPVDTTSTSQGTTNQSGNTTQQGTQTQQGTNIVSGNPMGGLFSGIGSGLMGPSSGTGSNMDDIWAKIKGLFGGGGGS